MLIITVKLDIMDLIALGHIPIRYIQFKVVDSTCHLSCKYPIDFSDYSDDKQNDPWALLLLPWRIRGVRVITNRNIGKWQSSFIYNDKISHKLTYLYNEEMIKLAKRSGKIC